MATKRPAILVGGDLETLDALDTIAPAALGPGSGSGTSYLNGLGSFTVPSAVVAPAGAAGDVQYNNAGVTGGAANASIADGNLALVAETTPSSTLSVTYFKFVNWLRAGMGARPSIKTSDIDTPQVLAFDDLYHRNSRWYAVGNSSTGLTLVDSVALTAVGTVTGSALASTSLYTQIRKVEYLVTVAAVNAIASYRSAMSWYRGNAAGKGGFRQVVIWGPATGVAVATSRAFVGMGVSVVPTDIEPSTITQMVGMGWDAADANIQMMSNGPTGLATKTDLGASFAVPVTDRSVMYRLELYCAPFSSSISYTVTNLITNVSASGTLTVNLPTNTTLLIPRGHLSVGGTSSVVGISFSAMSVQTSY